MARNVDIARALAVSAAQVTRWRARGMPGEIEAARAWHKVHIRTRRRRNGVHATPPGGNGVPVTIADPPTLSWRDRKDRADALLRELELGAARGRYLDRDAALAQWIRTVQLIRTKALAIPYRAVAELPLSTRELQAQAEAILTRLIHEMLHELANEDDGSEKE